MYSRASSFDDTNSTEGDPDPAEPDPIDLLARHLTIAPATDYTCREWAALLPAVWPAAYIEPPPPVAPSRTVSRADRVAMLERRHEAGVSLWHPADVVHQEEVAGGESEAAIARRHRNGADNAAGGGLVLSHATQHATHHQRG